MNFTIFVDSIEVFLDALASLKTMFKIQSVIKWCLSDPSGTDLSLVFSSSWPVSDYYTIHFLKAHDISSPFFYFLTFEKADCSIFTLSVGWLVDVTINFFNMQFSAFFLFSNFRKGRLLYIHPVGRLVGWRHH